MALSSFAFFRFYLKKIRFGQLGWILVARFLGPRGSGQATNHRLFADPCVSQARGVLVPESLPAGVGNTVSGAVVRFTQPVIALPRTAFCFSSATVPASGCQSFENQGRVQGVSATWGGLGGGDEWVSQTAVGVFGPQKKCPPPRGNT